VSLSDVPIGPAAEHEVDLRGQMFEQERQGVVQLRRLDDVVVIEHQHRLIAEAGEVVEQ
jgi:hypothetical protein